MLEVSVITPTFNRISHLRNAIKYYRHQTFPHVAMEWIILDDGTESAEAVIMDETFDLPNIRYIRSYKKETIGTKRNRLNAEALAPIIVAWDDDDYYHPDRIKHIVDSFKSKPTLNVAGSSIMYFYFEDDNSIWKLGPFGPNHSTNGPLAYRASYAKTHKYDETVKNAEEPSFLNNFTEPMIQLDPMKAILVMVHDTNTVKKDTIRTGNPAASKTTLSLKDFMCK
jgi:glycosyltransferase involved in cell wall biosynthesis